ncbi:hypothetical protein SEA_MRMIYAGI_118 [Mycobacterium phage MrMiyagi]|uniref:Uncharacterized protein n=1 Tax=Mycobacterium phage MrMiyagi TaxID=2762395 RepID=A0A7G8LQ08_9CAUD|nr:hypothetical protein SEA_MRMIYAGI_118 [Mycobacterium phage MrMiyagi]
MRPYFIIKGHIGMQRTIIGTPSKLKIGVRLDHSKKFNEYIIRAWWIGKGMGRIGFHYRKPEYPDSMIMNRSLLIDWQWTKDND